MLLAGTGTAWADGMLYLSPNSNWKNDGAWFAAYFFNNGETWVKMEDSDGNGIYECIVPNGWEEKNVIFVRMDKNKTLDSKWDGKWNQTSDLSVSDGRSTSTSAKKYTITGWDKSGKWEDYSLTLTGYKLAGFNDWNNPISMLANNSIYTCQKTLAKQTYAKGTDAGFKIKAEYSDAFVLWYGNDGTMTRNGQSVQSGGWSMELNKPNCGITADVAGTYTFTFDASTKKLTVTYPEPCFSDSDVAPGSVSVKNNTSELCGSGTVELTLSGTTTKDGLTKTIAWQSSTDNRTWTTISGQTGITYSPTVSSTTYYRAKVTWEKSGCNDIVEETSSIQITVKTKATLSWSTAPSSTMYLGDTKVISATLNPSEAGSVTYSSDKTNVVSVSNNTLTAKGTGTAIITATPTLNANYCGASQVTQGVEVKALPKPSIIMKETVDNKEVPATYTTKKSDTNEWRAHLKWSSDATYNTVMVVRYAHGASITTPSNGTEYSVSSKIGTGANQGTVVYKDTENKNECDDYEIEVGGNYDYYLYTVNNNYYSAASDAVNLNPRYTVAPDGKLGDAQHEWYTDYFYMAKKDDVWSYTFENKEAREYAFQIADGYTWENGWQSAAVDMSSGNISCEARTITNDTGTYTNIYFTTPTKGDITISYTDAGAYVNFTPDCITENDVNPGTVKSVEPLCAGNSFKLEFTTAPTDVNTYTKKIEWQKDAGDGTFITIKTADTHEVAPSAGTHTYRAKVTWTCSWTEKNGTENKCEISEETKPIDITVYATSVVNLTEPAKTICNGESFKLNDFVDNTTTVGTVTWRVGSATGNVVAGDESLSPNQTTTYFATAKNGVCGDSEVKTLEVTVKQRPTDVDFNYTIENVNYDGNTHSVAVTWKDGGSEGITVYYNDAQGAPSAVGEYTITVTTTAHGDLCETSTPVTLGILKIVCPEVPAPTIGETSDTHACNGTITANGKVEITNYDSKYDYYLNGYPEKLNIATEDNKHYVKFQFTSNGNYKLYAKSNCGTSALSDQFEIKYINTQPSVTAISINPESVCGSGEATITVTGKDATSYKLYEKTGPYTFVKDFTGSTVTVDRTGTYTVKAINGSCIGTSLSSDVTFTINPIPNDPVLVNPAPICQGESFTLPEKDGNQKTITWVGVTNTTLTNLTVGEHTYTAKIVENDCSSNEVTYTVTVKTKPTITNITVNNSTPVINEDVLLTVQGSDIASVSWAITEGSGELTDASGNSVKLTSTASGTVKVTATATSGTGCTATSTKEVTFSDTEDCEDDIVYDNDHVEIWLSSSLNTTMYLHRWHEKGNNDTDITKWPGASTTKSDGYYKWTTTTSGNIGYIFHDNTDNNKSSDGNKTLEKGYRYYFTFNGGKSAATFNKSERIISTTTPALVTAPAVKTVSATSVDGSGIVTFTGKIINTGCAATSNIYYGYQFKKADEEWPTTGIEASNTPAVGKLIPLTNASATALGYEFSTNIQGLANGDYHFRAYIINGYNRSGSSYDQGVYYGLDKLVTVSTVKTPVRDAVIYYSNMGGATQGGDEGDLNPNPVCKGSMAYIKLSYQGSQLDEIQWLVDGVVVENKIEQTSTTDLFVFTVSGTETISARLKNEENTDWVTTNTLEYRMAPEPVVPTISLSNSIICANGQATITVVEPIAGQTYSLYKGTELIGQESTYESGDLIYTVSAEGSYSVRAKLGDCPNYASSMAVELKVVSSDVTIGIAAEPTIVNPWQPLTITVTPPAGHEYTLNGLTDMEYKKEGNVYTVKIPRPSNWSKGNSDTGNNIKKATKTFTAEILVDGTTSCATKSVNVNLQDTEENCK